MKLPTQIGVVTNIDPEHMDYWPSLDALHQAFHQFIEAIPFYGLAVACIDHPVVRELLAKLGGAANGRRTLTYGVARDADIRLANLRPDHNRITFDADLGPAVKGGTRKLEDLTLPVLGHYNALNALGALAAATEAGVSDDVIRKTFAAFSGVKRRFTRVGEWQGVVVYDDYAHHPVEIAAVLRAARMAGKGRIIAVIQPHRYTRLQALFNEFSACLDDADIVVVTPVYSAGEAPIPGIDRDELASGLRRHGHPNVLTVDDEETLVETIASVAKSGDLVVGLGAGTITDWINALPKRLRAAQGTGLNGADLENRLVASLPELRGKLKAEASLKDLTWFRVGGPAEVLYSPADEADLAYFLTTTPSDIPVTVIGLGSNLLVRDGGIEGVVIRLGRGFGEIKIEDGYRLRAGAAVPDVKVARAAADAGIAGLSFYRGIPGCVGGALRMNGGAHGRETREVVVEARAVDRKGNVHVLPVAGASLRLSPLRRARGLHLHRGAVPGRARRAREDPRRDGRHRRLSRGGAADQEPHRRLDLQEPSGQEGLAAHRRRRLPRAFGRRRQGLGDALQLPHQRGQRHRRRPREARRDGARAGQGDERGRARMGDQAPRPPSVTLNATLSFVIPARAGIAARRIARFPSC